MERQEINRKVTKRSRQTGERRGRSGKETEYWLRIRECEFKSLARILAKLLNEEKTSFLSDS